LDSQAVLAKLVADGTLINPRGITGSSGSEHATIFDIAPTKKPLSQMLEQDYTVNRSTSNVLTTKDLQKYAIDNAERILASGKWIN